MTDKVIAAHNNLLEALDVILLDSDATPYELRQVRQVLEESISDERSNLSFLRTIQADADRIQVSVNMLSDLRRRLNDMGRR